METVKLTRDMIKAGAGKTGAFNRQQVNILGMEWNELKKGWVDRMVGTVIPLEDYKQFLSLRPGGPAPELDSLAQADLHMKSITSGIPAGWSPEVAEIHERVQERIRNRRLTRGF